MDTEQKMRHFKRIMDIDIKWVPAIKAAAERGIKANEAHEKSPSPTTRLACMAAEIELLRLQEKCHAEKFPQSQYHYPDTPPELVPRWQHGLFGAPSSLHEMSENQRTEYEEAARIMDCSFSPKCTQVDKLAARSNYLETLLKIESSIIRRKPE